MTHEPTDVEIRAFAQLHSLTEDQARLLSPNPARKVATWRKRSRV